MLADCFRQLGDGRIEKLTRSYGTQAGSAKYNIHAQFREAERSGQKIMSLTDFKKAEAERKNKPTMAERIAAAKAAKEAKEAQAVADKEKVVAETEEKAALEANGGLRELPPLPPVESLTEQDMAFGLEVLPKLMNLQTVQLMKGDLHLSTKALEGYMGFHHLLLSILRQYPSLQTKVERKIGTFLKDEESRTKKGCPNIGEFLCLFAVSKKYTWDDLSPYVFKETLDRNASWAIDKYPILAKSGVSPEQRLEKTFKAGIVSIRLLCFNVWFLRNIVFQKFDEDTTSASIIAQTLAGPAKNCMDKRWEMYEARKGIPKPKEIDSLQEHMRRLMHGNGLNSWAEYFECLNLKPIKGKELSQLLVMSLHDSVRKGYIPRWKLYPKPPPEKKTGGDDHMGAMADKADGMFTDRGGNKW